MEPLDRPAGDNPPASRRTLRLTIKTSEEGFDLVSVERLNMITPPQPGERPEAGKHGGHWIELRDAENRVLAFRLIDQSLLNSVEVHSPDEKIRREFSKTKEGIFEVLLPDIDAAQSAVLVGNPIGPRKAGAKRAEPSGEIARFEISPDRKGR